MNWSRFLFFFFFFFDTLLRIFILTDVQVDHYGGIYCHCCTSVAQSSDDCRKVSISNHAEHIKRVTL